jgi:serine/threonine protein kinase
MLTFNSQYVLFLRDLRTTRVHTLVLELMEESLEQRLNAETALVWEQRVFIVHCVCRGLAHLHSLEPPLIHRDIKR